MGASWPSWRSWEGGVRMFSELVARNSRRSRRENGLFFTSLLISIVAFYIILSLSHQDVMVFLQRMESSAVDRLLSLVPVLYGLTLFILFFLVYYANRFQLARRRHEFGVYLMLGMQRRKLFGMLLAEDLRSSLIALAIGLPAALLISEVISLVTARLVGLGIVGHRFTLSLSAIGWTAVGFLAIKLLASLILSGKIVREEIGALLTETPEGTKKQRPAAVYAAALVLGTALLAGAYTFAILGYAWSGLRYMAGTIALGVAGTLLLFYGLRVIIDRLARRGDRAGRLRVFNFRQVEETVIHRSGALAICSLLILAALCCFGAGVATARSSRAETHTLDYTFPTDSEDSSAVRATLAAHGLDGAFSDLFEMRIGRVRTSTDYQNTVKFPALQRTIDAMPVSDEQQQLQYMLEAVGFKLDYVRNRMQAFIDQMLYYARLRGARRDYRFERLTLRGCIDEVLDDYRPLLEEKGFRVEIRPTDETVFADRRGLCFLLGQVVSNSVKYALNAPVLTFSLESNDTATVLSIRDNGPGVRACDLPYVFEKGFTGDSGHEKNKATGMGLYLAREVAKDLGLTLTAASDWGAGFEIRVTFPVVEE